MKRIFALAVVVMAFSSCSTVKYWWHQERPLVKKDVQIIKDDVKTMEQDFIDDVESSCNKTPTQ